MSIASVTPPRATAQPKSADGKRVILASAAGTVFEWYDFYLAGALATYLNRTFFSGVDETAGFILVLLSFAAGFSVRPIGALFFGRLGDLIGRKYTFLVTMLLMGVTTFVIGLLPSYQTIGLAAPIAFVVCRLLQGLALGGEYGGAAVYVAEHAPQNRRGAYTAWIQTTATLGLLLSLMVILSLRQTMSEESFESWGWRIPFLVSIVLLAISIFIRLQLNESPAFQRMKQDGAVSKAPLVEAFGHWRNARIALVALFGATAGQAVVWYAGQFYALLFLIQTVKMDAASATVLVALALAIGTPFFVVFGWLSDRIGRKWIILAGCLIAAVAYFPIFHKLAETANPALTAAHRAVQATVEADPATCGNLFDPVNIRVFTAPCDIARRGLAAAAIRYRLVDAPAGAPVKVTIGGHEAPVTGDFERAATQAALAAGYPGADDPAKFRLRGAGDLFSPRGMTLVGLLAMLVMLATMVYGPIAALLVELYPTRIRYSGLSLPYHIGNGWFGGFLPPIAFALVAATGDIYAGLWYPVVVAMTTFVIGMIFLPETSRRDIYADDRR